MIDSLSVSAGVRPLGSAQLAVVRAWAEGIDPAVAWGRFMPRDDPADGPRARREVAQWRERLQRIARLHGRPDIAALLGRDPEAIAEHTRSVPTLEAFQRGLDADFYSEAELLALYQETYGKPRSDSAARRRQRLRGRLLRALQWLEGRSSRPPLPDDDVALWLGARLAAGLGAVGVRSLDGLRDWISRRGFHWYRKVPRLGVIGAARVVRWLDDHAGSLGALPRAAFSPPGQRAPAAAPAPRLGIVPLERLAAAVASDGQRSLPAGASTPVDVAALRRDIGLVEAWLARHDGSPHTARSYRREAERFLLWVTFARGTHLAALTSGDCRAYRAFLSAPSPEWTAPRNTSRRDAAWRPFEGPLSAASQTLALQVVRTLCEALVRQQVATHNPWDMDGRRAPAARDAAPRRADAVWQPLQAAFDRPAASASQHRWRVLLGFTVWAGLRRSEWASARLSDLRPAPGRDGFAWIRVAGNRGSARERLVPPAALAALGDYLEARGLHREAWREGLPLPLVARLDREASPLSGARIYEVHRAAWRRLVAGRCLPDSGPGAPLEAVPLQRLRGGMPVRPAEA